MKLSQLFCLPLLAISINALAYTVISEKTTSSPGFNAHFEVTTMNEQVKKNLSPRYVSALSWAYDTSGHPMEFIKIQGDHNISITNETSQKRRYTYTYTLYCASAYASHEKTIELSPRESFTEAAHSYGVVQEKNEDSFGIHVGTKISGDENTFHQRDAILRIRR